MNIGLKIRSLSHKLGIKSENILFFNGNIIKNLPAKLLLLNLEQI